jgi:cytochrome c553
MKLTTTNAAILAMFAATLVSPLAAQEALPVKNCTWCHGSSAQGFANAPRIAGQKHQYLEEALLSFKSHSRDNPNSKQFMWGAAANLDREMMRDFALYFSQLPAEPARDGYDALVDEGKAIYAEGIPNSNVVSCIVCHGPNAEGFEAIPKLAGMSYPYLKRRMEEWNEGYHAAAGPMPRVTKTLTTKQIEALASYLSFLK